MEPGISTTVAPAALTATVKLTERVFEIKAVDKVAVGLLETINNINGQLDAAKTLRSQKSDLLSGVETKLVENALESTERAMGDVAEFLEPCHVSMDGRNGGLGGPPRLMFILRDSPKIPISMEQLRHAEKGLQTALNILSSRDGARPWHRPHMKSHTRVSPSNELSQLLTQNRARNMLRRQTMHGSGDAASDVREKINSLGELHETGQEADDRASVQSDTPSVKSGSGMDELFFEHEDVKSSQSSPTRTFVPYRAKNASNTSLNSLSHMDRLPSALIPGSSSSSGVPGPNLTAQVRALPYPVTPRVLSPVPAPIVHRQSAPEMDIRRDSGENQPGMHIPNRPSSTMLTWHAPLYPPTSSALGISRPGENSSNMMLPAMQPQSPVSPFAQGEQPVRPQPPDFRPPSTTSPFFRLEGEAWAGHPILTPIDEPDKHDSILSTQAFQGRSSAEQSPMQGHEHDSPVITPPVPHKQAPLPPSSPQPIREESPREDADQTPPATKPEIPQRRPPQPPPYPFDDLNDYDSKRSLRSVPSQPSIQDGISTFVLAFGPSENTSQPLFSNMVKLEAEKDLPEDIQSVPFNMVKKSPSVSSTRMIQAALESEFPEVVTDSVRMEGSYGARLESEFPELVPRHDPSSAPIPVHIVTEVPTEVVQRARTRRRQQLGAQYFDDAAIRAPEVVTYRRSGPPIEVKIQAPDANPPAPEPARRWSDNNTNQQQREPSRLSVSSGSDSGQTPALSGKARSARWRELQYERFQQLPRS